MKTIRVFLAPMALLLCLAAGLERGHATPLPVYQQDNIVFQKYCLTMLGYDPGPLTGVLDARFDTAWHTALADYARLLREQLPSQPRTESQMDTSLKAAAAIFQECGVHMLRHRSMQELPRGTVAPKAPVSLFPVNQAAVEAGLDYLREIGLLAEQEAPSRDIPGQRSPAQQPPEGCPPLVVDPLHR